MTKLNPALERVDRTLVSYPPRACSIQYQLRTNRFMDAMTICGRGAGNHRRLGQGHSRVVLKGQGPAASMGQMDFVEEESTDVETGAR